MAEWEAVSKRIKAAVAAMPDEEEADPGDERPATTNITGEKLQKMQSILASNIADEMKGIPPDTVGAFVENRVEPDRSANPHEPRKRYDPSAQESQNTWLAKFFRWLSDKNFTPYTFTFMNGFLTGHSKVLRGNTYSRELLHDRLIIPIIPFEKPLDNLNRAETGVIPHIWLRPNNNKGDMGTHITLYYTKPSLFRGLQGDKLGGPITMHIYRNQTINFNVPYEGNTLIYRPDPDTTISQLLENKSPLIKFKVISKPTGDKRQVTFPRDVLEQIYTFITTLDNYIETYGPVPYSYRGTTRGGNKTRKRQRKRQRKTKAKRKSKIRKPKRIKRKTRKY
jgi:hypothetical protein